MYYWQICIRWSSIDISNYKSERHINSSKHKGKRTCASNVDPGRTAQLRSSTRVYVARARALIRVLRTHSGLGHRVTHMRRSSFVTCPDSCTNLTAINNRVNISLFSSIVALIAFAWVVKIEMSESGIVLTLWNHKHLPICSQCLFPVNNGIYTIILAVKIINVKITFWT